MSGTLITIIHEEENIAHETQRLRDVRDARNSGISSPCTFREEISLRVLKSIGREKKNERLRFN